MICYSSYLIKFHGLCDDSLWYISFFTTSLPISCCQKSQSSKTTCTKLCHLRGDVAAGQDIDVELNFWKSADWWTFCKALPLHWSNSLNPCMLHTMPTYGSSLTYSSSFMPHRAWRCEMSEMSRICYSCRLKKLSDTQECYLRCQWEANIKSNQGSPKLLSHESQENFTQIHPFKSHVRTFIVL